MREEVINENNTVVYRNLYLPDFRSILHIYQEKQMKCTPGAKLPKILMPQLTEAFGLPLSVAWSDERIIGYAYIYLNGNGSTELACCFAGDRNEQEIRAGLERKAKKILDSQYENNGETAAAKAVKLRNAIQQLISWLNSCN